MLLSDHLRFGRFDQRMTYLTAGAVAVRLIRFRRRRRGLSFCYLIPIFAAYLAMRKTTTATIAKSMMTLTKSPTAKLIP